jgi:hypothetical protein
MTGQINLDFSRPRLPIEDEKRTQLISFRIGEKFKNNLEEICRVKGIDLSKLCMEYVIAGFLDDYKTMLLIESNGKRTVKDLLLRG